MTSTQTHEAKTGSCSDAAGSCATESKKEAAKSDECCGGGSCATAETKTVEKKHAGGCGC